MTTDEKIARFLDRITAAILIVTTLGIAAYLGLCWNAFRIGAGW